MNYIGSRIRQSLRLNALAVLNLGLLNALRLKYHQYRLHLKPSSQAYCLRSKYAAHPIWCRPGTTDRQVFNQIYVLREYSCLDNVLGAHLIVDCGANVGYSSVYFLSRYPNARVISVEPDPENIDLLERNLRPFGGRARVVRAAVWSHATRLMFDTGDGRGEWGIRVRECGADEPSAFPAVTIGHLLEGSGLPSISILKIDVEGAEAAIFARDYHDWLSRTDNLVIELHGDKCRESFAAAVLGRPFTVFQHEELTVCKRSVEGPSVGVS